MRPPGSARYRGRVHIRRTLTRSTSTGETYFTYRLVRSERHGQKVRAVTVLDLGRHFSVPKERWPVLCARLEELIHGQQALLPFDSPPSVEAAAQRYAAVVLGRRGERQAAPILRGKPRPIPRLMRAIRKKSGRIAPW